MSLKSNSFVAAAEQVCLQPMFLNTDSDEAEVTSLGRPFHTFAPATGKARPPTFNTQGKGTSQSLQSLYDRHLMGITWHNALS